MRQAHGENFHETPFSLAKHSEILHALSCGPELSPGPIWGRKTPGKCHFKQFPKILLKLISRKKKKNFFLNVSEKISITTKVTKPEGQYSKVSQVQFEKVQRKMANGMVQLLLQVLMEKLKMKDGIWDKKYEIKRLILSMNANFYYLIICLFTNAPLGSMVGLAGMFAKELNACNKCKNC